jgi:hypothetical protein
VQKIYLVIDYLALAFSSESEVGRASVAGYSPHCFFFVFFPHRRRLLNTTAQIIPPPAGLMITQVRLDVNGTCFSAQPTFKV